MTQVRKNSRRGWHQINVIWGELAQFAATLTKGAHIESKASQPLLLS
jgi:hypothetical protein